MNTEEIWGLLGVSHLRPLSRWWELPSKYCKAQKWLKKTALPTKSTLAKPTIYNRPCPEMLSTASTGNPVVVMKPSSLFCFCNGIKIFGSVDKTRGNLFFDNFRQWMLEKKSPTVKTCIKTDCFTHCSKFFSIQMTCITFRHAERAKL